MAGPNEDTRGDERRRSRFDVYSAVYDRFNGELLKCNEPRATLLAQSWIDTKAQFAGWLCESYAVGQGQHLKDE